MDIKKDSSFTERIQEIITSVGSAEKLAKRAAIKASSISQYLSGTTDPSRIRLIALATAAGVNIEWLATGVGPMREGDRERISFDLLAVIIEGLDDLEATLEKKLTSIEKAEIINQTYDIVSEGNRASEKEKFLIKATVKAIYNFFSSLDALIKTEKGQEQATKIFKRMFGKSLSKEKAEREAHEFIGTRLLKLHLK